MVANRTVLSTAPMLGLESRRKIMEFVYPLKYFYSAFIFQTPKANDLTGEAFLKPFSWRLWTCMVCSILLVATILWATIKVELKTSIRDEGESVICVPSLTLAILSTMGALCQQAMDLAIKWNATRVLQLIFFLNGVVLYNYYNSLIVSELISFPKATSINSMRALKDSNLKLIAQNISYVHYYMKVVCRCGFQYAACS